MTTVPGHLSSVISVIDHYYSDEPSNVASTTLSSFDVGWVRYLTLLPNPKLMKTFGMGVALPSMVYFRLGVRSYSQGIDGFLLAMAKLRPANACLRTSQLILYNEFEALTALYIPLLLHMVPEVQALK